MGSSVKTFVWTPFQLETIAMIIGVLNVLASIVCLIISSLKLFDDIPDSLFGTVIIGTAAENIDMTAVAWFVWSISILQVFFSFVLIVGLIKRNTKLIQTFLMFYIVMWFAYFLGRTINLYKTWFEPRAARPSSQEGRLFGRLFTSSPRFEQDINFLYLVGLMCSYIIVDGFLAISLYLLKLVVNKYKNKNLLPMDEIVNDWSTKRKRELRSTTVDPLHTVMHADSFSKIKVETMALIVAILNIVTSIMMFIITMIVLDSPFNMSRFPMKIIMFLLVLVKGILEDWHPMVLFVLMSLFTICYVILSFVLLVGILKKRADLVQAFYVFYVVMLFICSLNCIIATSKIIYWSSSTSSINLFVAFVAISYLVFFAQLAVPLHILNLVTNKFKKLEVLPIQLFTRDDPPAYKTLRLESDTSKADTASPCKNQVISEK